MSFALDIRKFAEKAKGRADLAVKGVVIAFAGKIDERSPVGDAKYWIYNRGTKEAPDYVDYLAYRDPPEGYVGGRFRGNWQLGVGSMPGGVLNRVDPTGERVRAEIGAAIPGEAAGEIYWLANNVPYAQRIENGWSRQAPTGVVGLTVTEFDSFVTAAVADAKAALP